jgi:hypothetical protein
MKHSASAGSPHTWIHAAISFIAPLCFLVVGFVIHGGGLTAFLCVLLLGLIAAAGVTSAVVALIRAQEPAPRIRACARVFFRSKRPGSFAGALWA